MAIKFALVLSTGKKNNNNNNNNNNKTMFLSHLKYLVSAINKYSQHRLAMERH